MATARRRCFVLGDLCEELPCYKNVWEPARGEALLVRREATNPLDKHAVAIYKEDIIVGHVYGNPFVTKSAEESHMSPQPGSQNVAV